MCHYNFPGRVRTLPKVKAEYFDIKRELICDAALRVCKTKPLYDITMKDVIRESGVSQGGIYRYFRNVDEILTAVMNRSLGEMDFKERVDEAVSGKDLVKAVRDMFALLSEYMDNNITTLGKFHFEMIELVAHEPERMSLISEKNRHIENSQYFINALFDLIRGGVESGAFRPIIPLGDIFCFISISIDGITHDGVLHKCYGLPEKDYGYSIPTLMDTLTRSVLHLLAPEEDENA